MLREISVRDLAVIGGARLEMSGRLTAITGETGAGKSLVVGAIGLALGDRADTQAVRTGAKKCTVSAVFDVPEPAVGPLTELGIELDDEGLFLSREVAAEGRSQCRANGRPVPASTARAAGELLVDLQGQHEHQVLLRPAAHRDALDEWIGDKARSLRSTLANVASDLRAVRARKKELEARARERERLIDLHRYELKEIREAALEPGEDDRLAAERKRMANAERLAEEIAAALAVLIREDRSAADLLQAAQAALGRAGSFDAALAPVLAEVQSAAAIVEEAGSGLAVYAEALEFDPERLEVVADRLDHINRLKRKYGATIDKVLAYAAAAEENLDRLEGSEEALGELRQRADLLAQELLDRCAELTKLRKAGAKRFAREVEAHLRDLAVEQARFEIELTPREPDATGAESVEFLFSANPGHPPRPLAKIVSGGELSRVMLALRCVLAGGLPAPTLVFDEVDAGLGGETASVVGRKLRSLSEHSQVIVITHLPQIASQADEQFRIEKTVEGGRTHVAVERLSHEQRVKELARMMGGRAAAQVALEHAREMLTNYSPSSPK
jgi:DNA repair protein RecN (Recombination protein N)